MSPFYFEWKTHWEFSGQFWSPIASICNSQSWLVTWMCSAYIKINSLSFSFFFFFFFLSKPQEVEFNFGSKYPFLFDLNAYVQLSNSASSLDELTGLCLYLHLFHIESSEQIVGGSIIRSCICSNSSSTPASRTSASSTTTSWTSASSTAASWTSATSSTTWAFEVWQGPWAASTKQAA